QKLALVKSGANAMCTTDDVRKRFEIQARELFKLFKYVEHNELEEVHHHYKNAISAVYDQMQEKRAHADNSELMAEINSIVSSYIGVSDTATSEDGKKFDISKIDFDRLRKEFERAQNKNLLMKDLQELVELRLAQMLKSNPLRINYYERYQKIVDEYNKDNEKDEIAIIFENLMNLVNDMDEEERRYVREGFNSDEELAIYDLLFKESLSKEEVKQVKVLAQTLLTKIKARIHELDRWTDKDETKAMISIMIRDLLYTELPSSYDDAALAEYRQRIFEYVFSAYPAA
ncbi:MAG: type I restriction endonuclease subunit R, partial [Petrimonas sp.]|nr:type I restriction endonuclease subunit R [Petrimonas sp.]